MSPVRGIVTDMTSFEDWRAKREAAESEIAASTHAPPTVTDIGHGLWLVDVAGTTRGFISQLDIRGEVRFEARLRHINPGQGPRIGEYWEFDKAVAAIVAESPRTIGRDPFAELTRYASREQMLERAERARIGRRNQRYML